jgi:hypothetical protein
MACTNLTKGLCAYIIICSPALVINIPMTDFTEDNGGTLVYLGTHRNVEPTVTTSDLGEHGPTGVSPTLCARRERVRPSQQIVAKVRNG